MKKSVIMQILNDFKGRMETKGLSKNERKNLTKFCDAYDKLKEKLSPELLNLHQQIVDAIESSRSDDIDFYFCEGFKLGLLLGIECIESH